MADSSEKWKTLLLKRCEIKSYMSCVSLSGTWTNPCNLLAGSWLFYHIPSLRGVLFYVATCTDGKIFRDLTGELQLLLSTKCKAILQIHILFISRPPVVVSTTFSCTVFVLSQLARCHMGRTKELLLLKWNNSL